jgi:hydroxymethylpyrimidine/phosphomethylpyrimidine kinase
MNTGRKVVLSIGGFDPCAGAGVLADVKVFEMIQVQGMAVCTALTFQHESRFEGVHWVAPDEIKRQLQLLFEKYRIGFVKIGLIQGLDQLEVIVDYLLSLDSSSKVIWDPIFSASAGYEFHRLIDEKQLIRILGKIYLVIPNLNEIAWLNPGGVNALISARKLSKHCLVLLKGGHADSEKAEDILFVEDAQYSFSQFRIKDGEKHGSGCVLSSALTAYLARGYDVVESCRKAKNYTTDFLSSTKTLLGYHNR